MFFLLDRVRRTGDEKAQEMLVATLKKMAQMTMLVGTKQDALGYMQRAQQVYDTLLKATPDDVASAPLTERFVLGKVGMRVVLDEGDAPR